MAVDLRHFRSFVVVAEEGNIGRAARRLFITQPALSRQMQQLESEIGEQLLTRTARGVELTEAGHELNDKARVALEAAEDALTLGRRREPHGRLAIGLSLAGGRDRWAALVQAFAERYPDVDVEVHTALSEPLQRQVLAGDLDVALVLSPTQLPGLAYAHVHDEPLSIWVHADHPLATRRQLALEDLDGHRIGLIRGEDQAPGFNLAIRELFEGTDIHPRFEETREVFPARAVRSPDFLALSVPLDFAAEVVRVPLVPERTLPFDVAQRVDAQTAAIRAFAPFAARHLAGSCAQGMPVT